VNMSKIYDNNYFSSPKVTQTVSKLVPNK